MFIPPPAKSKLVEQPANQWLPHNIEDFSGGLHTNEPSASLKDNEFSVLSNWYLHSNGSLVARGPYRPWLVASESTVLPNTAPPLTFTYVELRGSNYMVASWDAGATDEVSVYDETNDRWAGEVAGTPIKTGLTSGNKVRYAKYSVNEAEDLIFCNGKDTPQRWVGTVDTPSTDLGLAIPTLTGTLTITNVTAANPGVVTTSAAHGLTTNDVIAIDGVIGNMGDDVLNDNNFTITVVTATTFSIGASTAGKTYTSDGTVYTKGLFVTAAATAGGRGIITNGTYYYKGAYVYDDSGTSTKYGESGPPATVAQSCTVTGAAAGSEQQNTLLGFTFPTGVDTIKMYRSPPDTPLGPFRLVGENIETETDFVDIVPVGEEGVEVTIDAGTPPTGLKNIISYDGRIWGIGQTTGGALTNKGVWTRKGSPDFFPATEYIYFPGPLTGPFVFNKLIYWFTETQIWVTTDLNNPLTSTVKIADIGCDAFDSIVDVGSGLVWQFDGNIYWANFNAFNPVTGELPWPIGDPISDKIIDIPIAQRKNSAGAIYKDRYYLSITGPGQTVNSATIVWDTKHGTRLLRNYEYGGWSSVDWSANDLQTFDRTLYSADNTNMYIMEHDFAGTADYRNYPDYDTTSYNISTQISTGILHFGHEWSQKLVNSLSIVCKSTAVTFVTTLSFDGGDFTRTKSFTLGSGTFATSADWLIWGQGTWGNFKWGSTTFGFQSDHQRYAKGGKCRNVKLTLESTDSQDTTLIAAKLYYKMLPTPA